MAAKKSTKPAKNQATKRAAKKVAKKTGTKKVARPRAKKASGVAAAGWQDATLARVRRLIEEAVPDVVEEQKWRKPSNAMQGVPVWSHEGILCTGETYKDKVKLTFAKGAALQDPARLFNSSLDGGTRRAIDLFEGDKIDADAFQGLVRAAADLNGATKRR